MMTATITDATERIRERQAEKRKARIRQYRERRARVFALYAEFLARSENNRINRIRKARREQA